jgi:hypothetical protein
MDLVGGKVPVGERQGRGVDELLGCSAKLREGLVRGKRCPGWWLHGGQ